MPGSWPVDWSCCCWSLWAPHCRLTCSSSSRCCCCSWWEARALHKDDASCGCCCLGSSWDGSSGWCKRAMAMEEATTTEQLVTLLHETSCCSSDGYSPVLQQLTIIYLKSRVDQFLQSFIAVAEMAFFLVKDEEPTCISSWKFGLFGGPFEGYGLTEKFLDKTFEPQVVFYL